MVVPSLCGLPQHSNTFFYHSLEINSDLELCISFLVFVIKVTIKYKVLVTKTVGGHSHADSFRREFIFIFFSPSSLALALNQIVIIITKFLPALVESTLQIWNLSGTLFMTEFHIISELSSSMLLSILWAFVFYSILETMVQRNKILQGTRKTFRESRRPTIPSHYLLLFQLLLC